MEDRSQAALRAAYSEALAALRMGRAETAERQLRAIQAASPGEINSLHLLGLALLTQGKVRPAIETLERAVAAAPAFARARVDLARAYREDGRLDAARQELRRVLKEAPSLDAAWLAYGDVLVDLEKYADAKFAFEQARLLDPQRQRIEEATASFVAGDGQAAEGIFRDILKSDASHVASLCGLAAISLGAGNIRDAERLLRHALKQTAHSPLARRGLSHTLLAAGRLPEAETSTRALLKLEPENPQNWVALGSVYTRLLRQADALAAYEEAARLNPTEVRLRLSIGHIHKTLGRREDCEKAYLECLRIDPGCGEAYWSLADLKTYVFGDEKVAAMRGLLADPAADNSNKAQLHFALARALEQRKAVPGGFHPLRRRQCAASRLITIRYRELREEVEARRRLFRRRIFCRTAGRGMPGCRADLHRGPAAIRLDPHRADTRQPLACRGHDGATQYSDDGARVRSLGCAARRLPRERSRSVAGETCGFRSALP